MDYKLNLFKLINSKDNLSQREIANNLNVSLGKVNATIKQLEEEQYIKIEKINNKQFYKLTEKSFKELKDSIKNARELRINIHSDDEYENPKIAVILAAGKKTQFDKPVSFLTLEESTVLDRAIEILKNNGIEKIIIVAGYKKEFYEEYKKSHPEINLVFNEEYKWTGSMASLAKAKELIDGDFILLENDLVFEEQAIKAVVESSHRDCILITNESGSGDEAFVEIRNNYLFKMSKDIHQFNKIDGEMIGISKLSFELYQMMLEEFKENINPYINYEYTMLDVSREYKVGYEKVVDLVWGEIDNKKQYEKIKKITFPRIKKKEINYKLDYVKEVVSKSIDVDIKDIRDIRPIGGMTNKNFKVVANDNIYIARIPGNGTEGMIDRHNEMINSILASEIGIDAEIIFFDELSGIKIARYIEGAETINSAMARSKEHTLKIAKLLKKLHQSNINMKNEFNVFKEIYHYEELLEKVNGDYYENYNEVKKDILEIETILKDCDALLVPCHIDTVPENFIKDKWGKIYLIDWEYSGLNDPMWDVAAHFIECEFTEDEEEMFLKAYFNSNVTEKDKIKILCHKICQDFLWSLWTCVKEAQGDNFGDYGKMRYKRAIKNLAKLKENMAITYN